MAVTTTPFGDASTDILDLTISSTVPDAADVGYYYRQIEYLPVAHVTIEEDHDDELVITQHPVEFGAIISDHAYKKPSEVRIRCAWNNSGGFRHNVGSTEAVVINGYEGYARAVYEQILALQISRKPFPVITGKRIYKDMLVANIRVHTAPGSEYTLMADIVLREVILVSTKTLNVDGTVSRMTNSTEQLKQGQKEAIATENASTNIEQASGVDIRTTIPQAPTEGNAEQGT